MKKLRRLGGGKEKNTTASGWERTVRKAKEPKIYTRTLTDVLKPKKRRTGGSRRGKETTKNGPKECTTKREQKNPPLSSKGLFCKSGESSRRREEWEGGWQSKRIEGENP